MGAISGGFGAGLISGAVLGLMAWLAFGWKPNSPATLKDPSGITVSPQDIKEEHLEYSSTEGQQLSPTEYGHWLIGMAHDNACNHIDNFLFSPKFSGFRLADRIRENKFPANLQFLALYAAIYWQFAAIVLRATAEQQKEIAKGMAGAFDAIRPPNGFDITDTFNRSFRDYCQSIAEDLNSDPEVANPDVSNLSATSLQHIWHYYPADETDVPNQLLGQLLMSEFVADMLFDIFKLLRESRISLKHEF